MLIAVCIPVFNELPIVSKVIEEALGILRKSSDCIIIFVNDGSTDGSREVVCKYAGNKVTIVNHSSRRGVGDCVLSGLRKAKELGATHFVFWPGNLRIPLSSALGAIELARSNPDSYIHGNRFGAKQNTPVHRQYAIRLLSLLASLASQKRFNDITCGLRVFPVSLVDFKSEHVLAGSRYRGEQEISILALKKSIAIIECQAEFVYSDARKYSHIRPLDIVDVLKPWLALLVRTYFTDFGSSSLRRS